MAKKPVTETEAAPEATPEAAPEATPEAAPEAAIADQGKQAKALGLTEAACPYAEGGNRVLWLAGFAAE